MKNPRIFTRIGIVGVLCHSLAFSQDLPNESQFLNTSQRAQEAFANASQEFRNAIEKDYQDKYLKHVGIITPTPISFYEKVEDPEQDPRYKNDSDLQAWCDDQTKSYEELNPSQVIWHNFPRRIKDREGFLWLSVYHGIECVITVFKDGLDFVASGYFTLDQLFGPSGESITTDFIFPATTGKSLEPYSFDKSDKLSTFTIRMKRANQHPFIAIEGSLTYHDQEGYDYTRWYSLASDGLNRGRPEGFQVQYAAGLELEKEDAFDFRTLFRRPPGVAGKPGAETKPIRAIRLPLRYEEYRAYTTKDEKDKSFWTSFRSDTKGFWGVDPTDDVVLWDAGHVDFEFYSEAVSLYPGRHPTPFWSKQTRLDYASGDAKGQRRFKNPVPKPFYLPTTYAEMTTPAPVPEPKYPPTVYPIVGDCSTPEPIEMITPSAPSDSPEPVPQVGDGINGKAESDNIEPAGDSTTDCNSHLPDMPSQVNSDPLD